MLARLEVIVVFVHGLWDVGHVYLHSHHVGVVLHFDVLVGRLLEGLKGERGGKRFFRGDRCLRSHLSRR